MVLKITEPVHGDILNRRHGRESNDGLAVQVKGTCRPGAVVSVNGGPARVAGTTFSAAVTLTRRETPLVAVSGEETDSVLVLYDRNSFPRYRFSLDDNIWFLRDIAAQRYKSLLENPYLALWKRLYDTYGTKTVCNIYYQCDGFNLSMMPDTYKSQWADISEWFRLTFHALQNDPDRPYINANYAQVARDYDKIANEIQRFAGDSVTDTFTTVHWGEITRDACRAVRDRGIRGLCSYFWLQDGTPRVALYLDPAQTAHVGSRDYWKDVGMDLVLVRHAIVCNHAELTPQAIPAHLEKIKANPAQGEVLELMIHEQYFYPDYTNHRPDYADRCEAAVRWVTENGYAPVFYSDGFVGNPRG